MAGHEFSDSNKLEGRNAIFAMLAATYAATIGSDEIYLGYHQEPEHAPFPDATVKAVEGMQICINSCYSSKIRVRAPFRYVPRQDLIKIGMRLDPDFLTKTHTCYTDIAGGCGKCMHCIQKEVMINNIKEGRNDPIPDNF